MSSLVTVICYGIGRKFGVSPAMVQIALLALCFIGYVMFSPGPASMSRIEIVIWIGFAAVAIGIGRLIDKDWFKVPPPNEL